MIRLIINADDCGHSNRVNSKIEEAIVNGKITSTTVMANMDDFPGAQLLYERYKGEVSFGFHINLTEGTPLLYSQLLLDSGFYKECEGKIVFNAKPFRRKWLSSKMREEIFKEVLAQAKRIDESGIKISHIDGHHFIHQSIFMIPLLPRLCKAINVHKIRTYRNYMPFSLNRFLRNAWSKVIKLQDPKAQFTNWFTSFEDFYSFEKQSKHFYKADDIVELMCHPGGKDISEADIMANTSMRELINCQMINYNQI